MRRQRSDPQLVVRLDDLVEPAEAAHIDEDAGGRQAGLEERQQAVTTGRHLRLALALLQHPQHGADVPGLV